ncbi:hypothetical protein TIFTF001_000919 [Ficus carica]|uniref:Uncharacterized protein n=1 Tax=Ficus carica TaxID=3494 RepID=A0AA88CP22_FICCA|nr:hypothetical protein TIFTF001_000919 [Ficus carica]
MMSSTTWERGGWRCCERKDVFTPSLGRELGARLSAAVVGRWVCPSTTGITEKKGVFGV